MGSGGYKPHPDPDKAFVSPETVASLKCSKELITQLLARADKAEAALADAQQQIASDHEEIVAMSAALRSWCEKPLAAQVVAWKIKAKEARREALEEVLAIIPGGNIYDPQEIADQVRALAAREVGQVSWLYGNVTVEEALSEIMKLAAENVMDVQRGGRVHIVIESDGSYTVQEPQEEQEMGRG